MLSQLRNRTSCITFKKPFQIELYNKVHFHPHPSDTTDLTTDTAHSTIDQRSFQQHPFPSLLPSIDELHVSTNTKQPSPKIQDISKQPSAPELLKLIQNSKDKLFLSNKLLKALSVVVGI